VPAAVAVQAKCTLLDPSVKRRAQMLLRLICLAGFDEREDRRVVELFDLSGARAAALTEPLCDPHLACPPSG